MTVHRHRIERRTVDLAPYPDLVVIYLGMRLNAPAARLSEEELESAP